MSSLMYPKVFSDFMKRQQSKGGALIRSVPTPVYLHGMLPGGAGFSLTLPAPEKATFIKLLRVCPLKDGKRVVSFLLDDTEVVDIAVKDSTGVFVYEGAMAIPGDVTTVLFPN